MRALTRDDFPLDCDPTTTMRGAGTSASGTADAPAADDDRAADAYDDSGCDYWDSGWADETEYVADDGDDLARFVRRKRLSRARRKLRCRRVWKSLKLRIGSVARRPR